MPVCGVDSLPFDAILQGAGSFQAPERGDDSALIGNLCEECVARCAMLVRKDPAQRYRGIDDTDQRRPSLMSSLMVASSMCIPLRIFLMSSTAWRAASRSKGFCMVPRRGTWFPWRVVVDFSPVFRGCQGGARVFFVL